MSLQGARGEAFVDAVQARVHDVDEHVRPRDEPLHRHGLADERMIRAHREHEVLLEQHFELQLAIRGLAREAEVEETRFELLEHVAGDVTVGNRQARRLTRQPGEHVRHDDRQRVVGARDAQASLGACGVEAGRAGELAYLRQHLAQRAGELRRAWREHHLLPLPHQQRVAEVAAQSPERVTDGRLADPEPLRGAADLPLFDQDVKRSEQVQVEVLQVHDRGV